VAADLHTNNLPVRLTSFVGRMGALEGVGDRLRASRIVSIVGPGGVGKSRLAVEAASVAAARFSQGVWIAELHSTDSEEGIYAAIATAFDLAGVPGVTMRGIVESHLRDSDMLLILDNCEHIANQVGLVMYNLAETCPGLRLLATSRERMRMTWETVWPLTGLEIPASTVDPNDVLPESLELFRQRGQAVDPDFEITDATVEAVCDICRRLDGLPLAIELAAARLDTFSPLEICDRLDNIATFLIAPHHDLDDRHSSMQTVMSWSYGLLSPTEQATFARLGVFSGGFDCEMGRAIGGLGQERSVFEETLESLIAKSLVTRTDDTIHARYRLLESLRQFALGLLASQQQLTDMRAHHAAQFTALAAESVPKLWSRDQAEWLIRLEADHDNYRTALAWLLDNGTTSQAQQLAGSLARFWDLRGHYSEGLRWLRLACQRGITEDPAITVLAWNGLATLALLNGDIEASMEACHVALEAAEACHDLAAKAYALQYLGLCSIYAQDLPRAREVLDRSVVAADLSEQPLLSGWSGVFLTAVELFSGDLDAGRTRFLEARHLLEMAEDSEGVAWTHVAEAIERWQSDDLSATAQALRAAMGCFGPLRAGWGASVAGVVTGRVLVELDQHAEAVAILAQSETLRASIGAVHLPEVDRWLAEGLDLARAALGPTTFTTIYEDAAKLPARGVQRVVEDEVERLVAITSSSSDVGEVTNEVRIEDASFVREGDVWALAFRGRTVRLRHLIGFDHLAVLLSAPGREVSAIELATSRGRSDVRVGGQYLLAEAHGDDLLDSQAVLDLKARLSELEQELAEAERWADSERVYRSRAEFDAIASHLAADLGLSGKSRRFGSPAERARVNVTKAIRSGIAKIAETSPDLGKHLTASVRTGTLCGYWPDPSSTIRWTVSW
jgi:predicted ATPase